jgi:hypothetical protein
VPLSKADRFAGIAATVQRADQVVYGEPIATPDAGRIVAKPIGIFELCADLTQPRRSMPSIVRAGWDGRAETIPAMLQTWGRLVEQESGRELLLADFFEVAKDTAWNAERGPIEQAFLELASLAQTICQEGLANPITYYRDGSINRIETGERRWLAYHLLYAFYQDALWAKIPAHLIDAPSVWRQAAENGARANLNAIARTRQLAKLIMALHDGEQFATLEELAPSGACDRAYYAQVADGERYRIPRGASALILAVMGLKNPVQLRQHRALLNIPDELWTLADDQNLALDVIARQAKGKPNRTPTVTKITVAPIRRWIGRVREMPAEERQTLIGQVRELLEELERFKDIPK